MLSTMGIRSMNTYAKLSDQPSEPYCRCLAKERLKNKCNCGENPNKPKEWTWDTHCAVDRISMDIRIEGDLVIFHPMYSQGTAVVRGSKPLQMNSVHYWEMKICSPMTGTETMVGFGTSEVDLLSHQYSFCSVLGLDDQSWAYSYRGITQHAGKSKHYSRKFSFGCIVGVYLDLFLGRVVFYLNRRPLSVAYNNINCDKRILYYPMACSTSAKCSMKLINACSFPESLTLHCMKVISKHPTLVQQVQQYKHLQPICERLWFMLSPEQHQYSTTVKQTKGTYYDDLLLPQSSNKEQQENGYGGVVKNIYDFFENEHITQMPCDKNDGDSSDDDNMPLEMPIMNLPI